MKSAMCCEMRHCDMESTKNASFVLEMYTGYDQTQIMEVSWDFWDDQE